MNTSYHQIAGTGLDCLAALSDELFAIASSIPAAGLLSHLEVALAGRWRRAASAAALAMVGALSLQDLDALARSSPFGAVKVPPAAVLAERVGPDDVVLADLDTGWGIPAYAGRVVAPQHPLYWVPDHDQRRRDVRRFFEPVTGDEERRHIMRRWDVRFLVLDRRRLRVSDDAAAAIGAIGRTVASCNGLVLVDVKASASP